MVPAGQANNEHKPEMLVGTYVPTLQLTHGVAELLSASDEPAGHTKSAQGPDAFAGTNAPRGHATHGVAGLPSSSVVPTPHATHGVVALRSVSAVPLAQRYSAHAPVVPLDGT